MQKHETLGSTLLKKMIYILKGSWDTGKVWFIEKCYPIHDRKPLAESLKLLDTLVSSP